jgi:hypothetical protein
MPPVQMTVVVEVDGTTMVSLGDGVLLKLRHPARSSGSNRAAIAMRMEQTPEMAA